jgi:hypothetical protein
METTMAVVYLLEHYHPLPDDPSNMKLIGVYTTLEKAQDAAYRLAQQPGFRDLPGFLEDRFDPPGGFWIWNVEVDKDHWTEGYVTA